MTDRLLTPEELAARWQVPKSHVYRLAREGRVPSVALGRYCRFRLDTILAWEAEQEGRENGDGRARKVANGARGG